MCIRDRLLAWVALRTGSIWTGVLLHALHNGLLLTVSRYEEQLKSWSVLVQEGEHLPPLWLFVGGLCLCAGCGVLWWSTRSTARQFYALEPRVAEA